MKKFLLTLTAIAAFSTTLHAEPFDPNKLPEPKRTIANKYLSAKEAYEMKTTTPSKVLFIDVRTPAETEYVGIANQVDLNIPYVLDDYSSWDSKKNRFVKSPNSGFTMKLEEVIKARNTDRTATIILICRSGDRSASAATLLTKAGYTNVYSVYDGFEGDMSSEGRRNVNGWKNAKLPWGYSLNKERAYFIN